MQRAPLDEENWAAQRYHSYGLQFGSPLGGLPYDASQAHSSYSWDTQEGAWPWSQQPEVTSSGHQGAHSQGVGGIVRNVPGCRFDDLLEPLHPSDSVAAVGGGYSAGDNGYGGCLGDGLGSSYAAGGYPAGYSAGSGECSNNGGYPVGKQKVGRTRRDKRQMQACRREAPAPEARAQKQQEQQEQQQEPSISASHISEWPLSGKPPWAACADSLQGLLIQAEQEPGLAVPVPRPLHSYFDPNTVERWPEESFRMVRKLQDASRNHGHVFLMKDAVNDRLVAVKRLPIMWMQSCHRNFVRCYPDQTELPWQDLGCNTFLTNNGYEFVCKILGVYRDSTYYHIVSPFATVGELFSWSETGPDPGHQRELELLPIARQMFRAVRDLHNLHVVHHDISMENILLTKNEGSDQQEVKVIDFSMSTTQRFSKKNVTGKMPYQAPECHTSQEIDGFLTDTFALGVSLYAMSVRDYPWLSTDPDGCKCFRFVQHFGFRKYMKTRKLRSSALLKVADVMSEPLAALLEGLLATDPEKRLTLGERVFDGDTSDGAPRRRSVWDEPWLISGPGSDKPAAPNNQ
eukprot:TRINITY_DN26647_c0_g3_i1.p1 TRINITY_DN26647_c0_g3~~TRINITY_DN26647_c0_g3_i1.p1  ORF type:complete len:572 (+),score=69.89 TRINITY_DN26647_c0_g3_i1:170-1885(+)